MHALQKPGALSRPFAYAMLSLALVACTRWVPQELTPAQVVSEMKPARIRVTRSDSTRLVLVQPQVAGDSMIGSVPGRRTSIPLSDVAAVSLRKGNPGGTVLVVLGVLVAAGVWVLAQLGRNAGY
jgi:hypothetical protein